MKDNVRDKLPAVFTIIAGLSLPILLLISGDRNNGEHGDYQAALIELAMFVVWATILLMNALIVMASIILLCLRPENIRTKASLIHASLLLSVITVTLSLVRMFTG